jgi:hypothetical protein
MQSVHGRYSRFRRFLTFSQSRIYFEFNLSREISPKKRPKRLKRPSYHTKSCKTSTKRVFVDVCSHAECIADEDAFGDIKAGMNACRE